MPDDIDLPDHQLEPSDSPLWLSRKNSGSGFLSPFGAFLAIIACFVCILGTFSGISSEPKS